MSGRRFAAYGAALRMPARAWRCVWARRWARRHGRGVAPWRWQRRGVARAAPGGVALGAA
jgi:hypothetical protein